MPDNRRIVYWDANVFLSYVNGIPDRVPILDALWDNSSSRSGTIKLFTSELSLVEVAFAASEQKRKALDPQAEALIDNLWNDPRSLEVVGYQEGIGWEARSLIRQAITRGWSLKPLDAIHLATAQWLSRAGMMVDEFHTYDNLTRYQSIVGFRIVEPRT